MRSAESLVLGGVFAAAKHVRAHQKVRSLAENSAHRAKIFFARCARAEEFRSPRSQIEIYARGGRGGGFADERPRSMFDRVTV